MTITRLFSIIWRKAFVVNNLRVPSNASHSKQATWHPQPQGVGAPRPRSRAMSPAARVQPTPLPRRPAAPSGALTPPLACVRHFPPSPAQNSSQKRVRWHSRWCKIERTRFHTRNSQHEVSCST